RRLIVRPMEPDLHQTRSKRSDDRGDQDSEKYDEEEGAQRGFRLAVHISTLSGRLSPPCRRAGRVPWIHLPRTVHYRRSGAARCRNRSVHLQRARVTASSPRIGTQTVTSVPRTKRNGRLITMDAREAPNDGRSRRRAS